MPSSSPAPSPAPVQQKSLPVGWTVLAALALSGIALLGALWWGESRRQGEPKPPPEKLRLRLDINSASAEELELLPGIGTKRALKIVKARQRRGAFRSLAELDEPDVLGPGTFERLAPHLAPLPGDRSDERP